ncbi:Glycogen synthase [Thalassocella blandensis]|nr:Glycogen synthase [Thalassocella blandensis]
MVAAENDALPGAKVGGVGDVIRDLPGALAKHNCIVDVVIPSYGFLSRLNNLEPCGECDVYFRGQPAKVQVLKVKDRKQSVTNYIMHHEEFYPKGETVYCNDEEGRPFATDATKFAFFCAAVAQALVSGILPRPNVIHCHDWHSALLLVLMKYAREYRSLTNIHTVYTIHNLAMQGIRPVKDDVSSLDAWFPGLRYSFDKVLDPRFTDCINPMRAGILLADKVNTVSPTYAKEILQASDHKNGIYGGEGLEYDLHRRSERGELFGIINGCEYPANVNYKPLTRAKLIPLMLGNIELWASKSVQLATAHWLAEKRIAHWQTQKNVGFTVVSVGRLTEQKARLLQTPLADNRPAIYHLLDKLGSHGTLLMLGSGDASMEKFLVQASGANKNFIFLNGYSDALSQELFKFGNLFLMPSSFEPCGISQMLAMRAGQPCLVNGVGGLKDTVEHTKNGFVFEASNVNDQAQAMVDLFTEAMGLYNKNREIWDALVDQAKKERFTWSSSAKQYIDLLY